MSRDSKQSLRAVYRDTKGTVTHAVRETVSQMRNEAKERCVRFNEERAAAAQDVKVPASTWYGAPYLVLHEEISAFEKAAGIALLVASDVSDVLKNVKSTLK